MLSSSAGVLIGGSFGGLYVVFFFQAEDGIRDYKVTGVQTCALPISDGAEHDPHDEPGGHLRRCYTRASLQAKRSVAAVREEVADVRVVLEEVVELDQVVRRQAGGRRLTRLRVLFVLLVEELRGERGIHIRAA